MSCEKCVTREQLIEKLLDADYPVEQANLIADVIFGVPTEATASSEPGDDDSDGSGPKNGGGHP